MEKFERINTIRKTCLGGFLCYLVRTCKAMHPVLEALKSETGDRARIAKIDVDQHEA